MFGLGTQELLVILALAFFVFGGKKLPELGSGLGRAIKSFKKEMAEVKAAVDETPKDLPAPEKVVATGE